MTTKKTNAITGQVENNTRTDIQVLKSIEAAFYNNNPSAKRRNTEKSLKWFSQYVPKAYNRVRTSQVMRDANLYADKITPGDLYFFVYDALHKDTLPIWDAFPLVFFFGSYTSKSGAKIYTGLNLHYLQPKLRLLVYKALLKLRTEKRYSKTTRLKMEWTILKNMSESKYFKHCVKSYREDHFRSRFTRIPPASWEMAIFLPVARWVGGTSNDAWKI